MFSSFQDHQSTIPCTLPRLTCYTSGCAQQGALARDSSARSDGTWEGPTRCRASRQRASGAGPSADACEAGSNTPASLLARSQCLSAATCMCAASCRRAGRPMATLQWQRVQRTAAPMQRRQETGGSSNGNHGFSATFGDVQGVRTNQAAAAAFATAFDRDRVNRSELRALLPAAAPQDVQTDMCHAAGKPNETTKAACANVGGLQCGGGVREAVWLCATHSSLGGRVRGRRICPAAHRQLPSCRGCCATNHPQRMLSRGRAPEKPPAASPVPSPVPSPEPSPRGVARAQPVPSPLVQPSPTPSPVPSPHASRLISSAALAGQRCCGHVAPRCSPG